MYTAVAYSVSLKRDVKVVMLVFKKGDKEGRALLYSTDTNLAATTLLTYYKARFQIEFVFRDAKQYTGLMDCQSCNEEAINFQLNASFTALNLMKIEDRKTKGTLGQTIISIVSWKRRKLNQYMIKRLFNALEIDLNDKKVRQVYDSMSNFGVIAA